MLYNESVHLKIRKWHFANFFVNFISQIGISQVKFIMIGKKLYLSSLLGQSITRFVSGPFTFKSRWIKGNIPKTSFKNRRRFIIEKIFCQLRLDTTRSFSRWGHRGTATRRQIFLPVLLLLLYFGASCRGWWLEKRVGEREGGAGLKGREGGSPRLFSKP